MLKIDPNNPAEQSPNVDADVRESAEVTDHNSQQSQEPATDRGNAQEQ